MIDNQLSVLVVDGTALCRKGISQAVNASDLAEATATAPTGEIALKKLAQAHFDLVLLDVDIPGLGGLETLHRIRTDFHGVDIIMLSGTTEQSVAMTIKAVSAGAFEFVSKPAAKGCAVGQAQFEEELLPVIQAVWRRQQMKDVLPAVSDPPDPAVPLATPMRFGVVVIGVSTGGPKALASVIPALPEDFPLPVLLVQHMPPTFTKELADDLNGRSPLEVREAEDGDAVVPGRVLVAAGDKHLIIRKTPEGLVAGLGDGPKENSCRPSVDVLFRSVAEAYGMQGVLALVMTGMGSDGLKGVAALKEGACHCLTQSRQTCVVYGMPGMVEQEGLSDESVDLEEIAGRLVALAMDGRGGA